MKEDLKKILEPTYDQNEKVALIEISIPGFVEMLDNTMEDTEKIVEILSREGDNFEVLVRYLDYKEYFYETMIEKLVSKKLVIDSDITWVLFDKIYYLLGKIYKLKRKYIYEKG